MYPLILMVMAIWTALAISGGQASASPDDGDGAASIVLADGIFGAREVRLELPSVGTKVARLLEKIDHERTDYWKCERDRRTCSGRVRSWRDSVEQFRSLDGLELLTAVNTMANGLIEYRDDLTNHGRRDYWATPVQSLSGFGDCEDFALLKYVTLRELGIADERMRIAVVMDVERSIGHAVLTVELGVHTFVLDNAYSRPRLDSDLAHYRPLYSVNTTTQWLNVESRSTTAGLRRNRPSAATILPGATAILEVAPAEGSAAAGP